MSDIPPPPATPHPSAAPMIVNCPHCRLQVNVPPANAGTVIECPGCRGKFQAPLPTAIAVGRGAHAYSAQDPVVRAFASKKIAAGICGILLGGFGVHKFILGLNNAGIIMLIVWLLGVVTGMCLVVPILASVAMGIIGLIEGILYLTKSDEEFYQTYAIERKEWF